MKRGGFNHFISKLCRPWLIFQSVLLFLFIAEPELGNGAIRRVAPALGRIGGMLAPRAFTAGTVPYLQQNLQQKKSVFFSVVDSDSQLPASSQVWSPGSPLGRVAAEGVKATVDVLKVAPERLTSMNLWTLEGTNLFMDAINRARLEKTLRDLPPSSEPTCQSLLEYSKPLIQAELLDEFTKFLKLYERTKEGGYSEFTDKDIDQLIKVVYSLATCGTSVYLDNIANAARVMGLEQGSKFIEDKKDFIKFATCAKAALSGGLSGSLVVSGVQLLGLINSFREFLVGESSEKETKEAKPASDEKLSPEELKKREINEALIKLVASISVRAGANWLKTSKIYEQLSKVLPPGAAAKVLEDYKEIGESGHDLFKTKVEEKVQEVVIEVLLGLPKQPNPSSEGIESSGNSSEPRQNKEMVKPNPDPSGPRYGSSDNQGSVVSTESDIHPPVERKSSGQYPESQSSDVAIEILSSPPMNDNDPEFKSSPQTPSASRSNPSINVDTDPTEQRSPSPDVAAKGAVGKVPPVTALLSAVRREPRPSPIQNPLIPNSFNIIQSPELNRLRLLKGEAQPQSVSVDALSKKKSSLPTDQQDHVDQFVQEVRERFSHSDFEVIKFKGNVMLKSNKNNVMIQIKERKSYFEPGSNSEHSIEVDPEVLQTLHNVMEVKH